VTFSSPITGCTVWNGDQSSYSGSVCSFQNAGYNGYQTEGSKITLGFQVD